MRLLLAAVLIIMPLAAFADEDGYPRRSCLVARRNGRA